jgi:signal peptidase II
MSGRPVWPLFLGLAATVVVLDQLTKAWLTSFLAPGELVSVVGDYVRLVHGQNSGALFGLFKDSALLFGVVSVAVIALIVAYHARSGRSVYLSITLGLLLGGAIGNLLDRLRLGYVVDFVDVGLGSVRFYTFNVADSAISLSIVLLLAAALFPWLVDGNRSAGSPSAGAPAAPGPVSEAEADAAFWADDAPPRDEAGS